MDFDFSAGNIIAGLLFSGVGFWALMRGKKLGNFRMMVLGGLLMLYPYFVSATWLMWAIGSALTAALFFWRD